MKHLYFARHGLSQLNADGLFAGRLNTPLVEEGRAQARQAGQEARALNIDLIVASPLDRALETARIIAEESGYNPEKIIVNGMLIERDFGELDNTPYTANPDVTNVKGFETDERIIERAQHVAAWLESLNAETILVVSHGSIGRGLRHIYQPETDFFLKLPNAHITKFL